MQPVSRSASIAALSFLLAAGPLAAAAQPDAPRAIPAATPIGDGAYKAIMEADPGLPTHTIYRPADLAAIGKQKLPIVAWGNGACANDGNRFRWFLSEIASHGYLVIAVGPIGAPALDAGPKPGSLKPGGPPPKLPPPLTHTAQLIGAVDWATAENSRKGGKYYHRLNPARIAVMGQSCGGAQAIEASADPRVTTTLAMNSGLFPDPTTMAGGKVLTKEDLKLIHGPIAYISGDASDVAFPNANSDFETLTAIPVFRAYQKGVPHEGTYAQPNGGSFGKVAAAWLDWRLKGEKAAGRMFAGPRCGLCRDASWVVRTKNLPSPR